MPVILAAVSVVGVAFALLALAVLVAIGRWFYRDASSRGSEWAWQWAVGIPVLLVAGIVAPELLLGLVPGLLGVILYFVIRNGER